MTEIHNNTCDYLRLPLPISDAVACHLIAYCVLNAFLTVLVITGNGIFFATLIKTSSLHTPSNVLLGVMCVSDIAVGVFVVPAVFVRCVFMLKGMEYSKMSSILLFTCSICNGLSLIFVVLVSIDRYIAICHPFTYQRVITCKKNAYAATLASVIWSAVAFASFISESIYWSFIIAFTFLSITVVCITYANIFRVILKKKRAVVTIQQVVIRSDTNQQREAKKQAKKSYTVCIMLALFVICYLPFIITALRYHISLLSWPACDTSEATFLALLWTQYLLTANSFINPMIYCFRLAEMRHAASRLIGLKR